MTDIRNNLADYLTEDDPLSVLWPHLVDAVFHENPREEHPERLSPVARTIYFVGCFDGEVYNGGFSQFFSNSSGNHVAETFDALREIQAHRCVELFQRSLIAFDGQMPPKDRQQRCEILFAFEENDPGALGELDEVFYGNADAPNLPPPDDLADLQLRFIRANADESMLAGP